MSNPLFINPLFCFVLFNPLFINVPAVAKSRHFLISLKIQFSFVKLFKACGICNVVGVDAELYFAGNS